MNDVAQQVNPDLQAIEDARAAGEFDTARELSDAYVQAHPQEFVDYGDKTLEQIVQFIDVARAAGFLEHQYRAEAWHLCKYPPQNIGGTVQPQPTRAPGTKYGN